jgi:hypothetical protein
MSDPKAILPRDKVVDRTNDFKVARLGRPVFAPRGP